MVVFFYSYMERVLENLSLDEEEEEVVVASKITSMPDPVEW